MTCDQLKEQEAMLRAQADTLLTTIDYGTNQANLLYLQILQSDTFGGTYPGQPLTSTAVMARIQYISMLNPQPAGAGNVMMQYYTLYSMLLNVEAQQASLTQTVAQLGSVLQQEIDQGC